jgi:hypothetical protein
MNSNPVGNADEVRILRTCVNDLVGNLALPPIWSGSAPNDIVKTLLDAVLRTLRLDFVFARLKLPLATVETIRLVRFGEFSADENDLRAALARWLSDDPNTRTSVIRWPRSGSTISVVAIRRGITEHLGELVAGSRRPDFPRKTERLVLNVAANQAVIGLQGAQLRNEQLRTARDLVSQIDESSRILTRVNEELKKESPRRKVAEDKLRLAKSRLQQVTQAAVVVTQTKTSKWIDCRSARLC